MPTTKKKSTRAKAKSAQACKTAGGVPVKFKGKKDIVCFSKSKSRKKKSGKKSGSRKGKTAGLKKACATMKKKGFTGKRASFKAACAAVNKK